MKSKIIILVLALGTIILWIQNHKLNKEIENYTPQLVEKIDTVYIDKMFTVEAPYKEVASPTKVKVYTKGLEVDTTANPKQDSVVQFKLNKNQLDLTIYSKLDSTVHTDLYNLDLDKYKYIYNNGILTKKKKLNIKLSPYLQAKYRPINQLYDVSAGLSLKNNHFSYSVGFDLGYYPKLTDQLQKDVEVSVTYNF